MKAITNILIISILCGILCVKVKKMLIINTRKRQKRHECSVTAQADLQKAALKAETLKDLA